MQTQERFDGTIRRLKQVVFSCLRIPAYLPQEPKLYSCSLRDNLLLGAVDRTQNIPYALYSAAAEDLVELLDDGLETQLGSKGTRLSGGQAQRLAAARMFLCDSEIYVIADLSSALDTETEKKLWSRLYAQHKTLIVVSNRPEVIRNASYVLVLRNGQVADEGSPGRVINNFSINKRY